jgi:hypothetical protein
MTPANTTAHATNERILRTMNLDWYVGRPFRAASPRG